MEMGRVSLLKLLLSLGGGFWCAVLLLLLWIFTLLVYFFNSTISLTTKLLTSKCDSFLSATVTLPTRPYRKVFSKRSSPFYDISTSYTLIFLSTLSLPLLFATFMLSFPTLSINYCAFSFKFCNI